MSRHQSAFSQRHQGPRSRKSRQRRRCRLEQLENRQLLAAEVLFADSFENGGSSNDWVGNWVEDSQDDWFRSTQRSTDGSYSAEVDGRASDATLTLSDPIDLSGYDAPQLTFDWLIENGFDGGEYVALDVSSDGGGSWTTDVRRLNGNSDPENTWHSETVDLSAYASTELLVRFRSQVSRSNEDANVDNLEISGMPVPTEPIAEFTPLGFLPGATLSHPRGMSADGRYIVGNSGDQAYRWSRGQGMIDLGTFKADDVSHDGSVVVGGDGVSNGYRWENGVFTPLGDLPGGNFSSLA